MGILERYGLSEYKIIKIIYEVMLEGDKKYGFTDWRAEHYSYHIERALTHIEDYNLGIGDERHLEHAVVRLLMAITLKEEMGDGEE